MFCNNCGTKNLDGAKFCMSCGAPLPVTGTQGQTAPVQHQMVQPQQMMQTSQISEQMTGVIQQNTGKDIISFAKMPDNSKLYKKLKNQGIALCVILLLAIPLSIYCGFIDEQYFAVIPFALIAFVCTLLVVAKINRVASIINIPPALIAMAGVSQMIKEIEFGGLIIISVISLIALLGLMGSILLADKCFRMHKLFKKSIQS